MKTMLRPIFFQVSGNLSGGIAQSVEQRDHNPQVGGSNPSPATSFVLAIRSADR